MQINEGNSAKRSRTKEPGGDPRRASFERTGRVSLPTTLCPRAQHGAGLPMRLGRANTGPKEEEVRLSRGLGGETAEASTPRGLPWRPGTFSGGFLTGINRLIPPAVKRLLRDLPGGVLEPGPVIGAAVWTPRPGGLAGEPGLLPGESSVEGFPGWGAPGGERRAQAGKQTGAGG